MRYRSRTMLAGALALTTLAFGPVSSAAAAPADRVNDILGLRASDVAVLDLDAAPGRPVLAIIPIDGLPLVLRLDPYSIRAGGYQVLRQGADGALTPVEPSPVRTLRGSLLGIDGTLATGSMLEDGLHATIRFDDGRTLWIEPVAGRVPGALPGQHAIYDQVDVIPREGTCDANGLAALGDVQPWLGEPETDGALCVAELACDADYEYFQFWGGVTNVENRINAVINAMNVQYERDVNITHTITTIIVRTSSNDPYKGKQASSLLNAFRAEWETNQTGIQRDVAQLFTGRDLSGTTIGVAWLGAVCTDLGYSLVQSDFDANFACVTDLSAHELGHNWGAGHCSCSSYTMNASITCANQFHPTFSIPSIVAHRDSRTCLDNCVGIDPTGACCHPDESCTVETAADCGTMGGTYQGDFTNCTPNPCGSGPAEAPITAGSVPRGTLVSGFLNDLYDSDNGYVVIDADRQGRNYRTELQVTCTSPFGVVSQLDLTTEVGVNVSGVDTSIALLNHGSGQFDVLETYAQPTGDTIKTYVNVSNPNSYVNGAGEIIVRISTTKRGGDHVVSVDHVEVIVTP